MPLLESSSDNTAAETQQAYKNRRILSQKHRQQAYGCLRVGALAEWLWRGKKRQNRSASIFKGDPNFQKILAGGICLLLFRYRKTY